jgi:hypothetical protein
MLTLLDIRQAGATPSTKRRIIDLIFETSPFATRVPFETVPTRESKWYMTKELPTAQFRSYGGSYTESNSKDDMGTTHLKILGGNFTIDRLDRNANTIEGTRKVAREIRNHTTSMGMKFKYNFINGALNNNPDEFIGLRKMHESASIFGTGMTLSLASAGSTFAAAGALAVTEFMLDFIQQTIVTPDVIFCDETHITQLHALSLTAGTNEAFAQYFKMMDYPLPNGRNIKVGSFNGIPMIPMKKDAQGNKVIDYNEPSPDLSNTDCSSLYSVCFGEEFFMALQHSAGGPEVTDAIQDGHYKTFLDWAVALEPRHDRSSARATGIKAV